MVPSESTPANKNMFKDNDKKIGTASVNVIRVSIFFFKSVSESVFNKASDLPIESTQKRFVQVYYRAQNRHFL